MIELLLNKRIEDIIKLRFVAKGYVTEYVKFKINNPIYSLDIDMNASYLFVSDKIDIPVTATCKIATDTNFINISKTEFEFGTYRNIDAFEGSQLRVTTENYGLTFVPYTLLMLKLTPHN